MLTQKEKKNDRQRLLKKNTELLEIESINYSIQLPIPFSV
jgi:hypothetical protein